MYVFIYISPIKASDPPHQVQSPLIDRLRLLIQQMYLKGYRNDANTNSNKSSHDGTDNSSVGYNNGQALLDNLAGTTIVFAEETWVDGSGRCCLNINGSGIPILILRYEPRLYGI